MKRTTLKPFWWLTPGLVIAGAEDPPPEGGETDPPNDDGKGGKEGEGSEGENDDSDDSDDDDDQETFTKADVEGLKKALKEERAARKAAERAAKAKEKAKTDDAAKDDAAKAADRLQAAEAKAAKLADGYRAARVESVITRIARAANVIDPDDMVALLKAQGYKDIDIDQDEDDPSQVDVDEDDVKTAVKKALRTRQHWLKRDDDEGDGGKGGPSGSKMVPKGQRKDSLDDEELKKRYPALANRL
jgi:hypothetical protein